MKTSSQTADITRYGSFGIAETPKDLAELIWDRLGGLQLDVPFDMTQGEGPVDFLVEMFNGISDRGLYEIKLKHERAVEILISEHINPLIDATAETGQIEDGDLLRLSRFLYLLRRAHILTLGGQRNEWPMVWLRKVWGRRGENNSITDLLFALARTATAFRRFEIRNFSVEAFKDPTWGNLIAYAAAIEDSWWFTVELLGEYVRAVSQRVATSVEVADHFDRFADLVGGRIEWKDFLSAL